MTLEISFFIAHGGIWSDILKWVLTFVSYFVVACVVSWYFYYYRRREIFGGFWGGVVIAFLGAAIFSILDDPFRTVILFLMDPKFAKVNLFAIALGSFLFLYILNKINHDRERKDY